MLRLDASMRRIWSCRRGTSAVELALLFLVFLSVISGIVAVGLHRAVVHDVQQLAADAARCSIARLTKTECGSITSVDITSNAAIYPLINASKLSVSTTTSSPSANVSAVMVNCDDASTMFIQSLHVVPIPPSRVTRSAAISGGSAQSTIAGGNAGKPCRWTGRCVEIRHSL